MIRVGTARDPIPLLSTLKTRGRFQIDPTRPSRPQAFSRLTVGLMLVLVPHCCAAATATATLNGPVQWPGLLALIAFALAYAFVTLEELTGLRKSTPVILAASIIWVLIVGYATSLGKASLAERTLKSSMYEFAELFLFLLVAMTYVNAMGDRGIFDALRGWLVRCGLSYRSLFWITGWMAFFISPFIDNMTTALVLSAVALAVGRGNSRFIALSCINIVVGANAGGAFSPFGDVTTLMVWQANALPFSQFFHLFIPAATNFVIPAAAMHFAVPSGGPEPDKRTTGMKTGGWRVIILFAATIATSVMLHDWTGLPPYTGMMLGLVYLQLLMYFISRSVRRKEQLLVRYRAVNDSLPPALIDFEQHGESSDSFNVFRHIALAEWDTLLFFYGVILCVGGLGFLGYLTIASKVMYLHWGATLANVVVGLSSSVVDNIPIMAAVIHMHPAMNQNQWLLVTLTAGVGGSLLSIGSAAGVALMGQARGHYTFISHLKWTPVIALGYAASIAVHFLVSGAAFL